MAIVFGSAMNKRQLRRLHLSECMAEMFAASVRVLRATPTAGFGVNGPS